VVSKTDLVRLCAFLDLNAESFERSFGERRGEKLFIRSFDTGCVFFRKGQGCSIHAAKPDICRAWPYFRGNLMDSGSYVLAKDFCLGIPQRQKHEAFVRQGLAYLVRENLVGSSRPDEAAALQVADLLNPCA